MDYKNTVGYLYSLQKHGIKLGLDNTVRLLSLLDNPQTSYKTIHLAGTNGKGSISAMVAAMLRAAGFRVGLFTSPHLVSFTERIKVSNEEIEEAEVISLTNELRNIIQASELKAPDPKVTPTFFEFVTVMAFLYFKRQKVDWAVIETGMGGRLDATNVVVPEVSVITKIGFDHKEFLGQTLSDIAQEKAGIIKEGVPVVSSAQGNEVMDIIRQKAIEKKTDLFVSGKDFTASPVKAGMQGSSFDYKGVSQISNLFVPLCGVHQVENASVAVRAVEVIMKGALTDTIRKGLAITYWPGRLELLKPGSGNYDILLDGAHNPSASEALAEALKRDFLPFYKKATVIFGIMADKDIGGIMKPVLPLVSEIILTTPDYGRAAAPAVLADYAHTLGYKPKVSGSVKEALAMAAKAAGNGQGKSLILITGSFYTIGEAKAVLGQTSLSPSLMGLR